MASRWENRGVTFQPHEEELFVPAYAVNIVDATGAGDAYVAGFLAGTVKGWNLKTTAELASATGAACVTAIGTTAGIKNIEETLKICQNKKIS